MDLRPARDPRQDVEPLPLALGVLLHLIAERRPRADHAHLPAHDVPELRQLVERGAAEKAADARDPAVAAVDRVAGPFVSAPTTIVRSFSSSKSWPSLPTRVCLNSTGPPSPSLTASAATPRTELAMRETGAGDRDVELQFQRVPSTPPTSRERRDEGSSRRDDGGPGHQRVVAGDPDTSSAAAINANSRPARPGRRGPRRRGPSDVASSARRRMPLP